MLIAHPIRRVWNGIQGSLWFVPSVLVLQLKVLREHAQAIMEDAERSIAPQRDREMIKAKMRSLEETFDRKESVLAPTP